MTHDVQLFAILIVASGLLWTGLMGIMTLIYLENQSRQMRQPVIVARSISPLQILHFGEVNAQGAAVLHINGIDLVLARRIRGLMPGKRFRIIEGWV